MTEYSGDGQPPLPKRPGRYEIKDGRAFLVPRIDPAAQGQINDYWRDATLAEGWAQIGGGINKKEREVVRDDLVSSGFYQGLTAQSSVLDLAVGSQSYLDPSLLPQGLYLAAADISGEMLQKLAQTTPLHYSEMVETDATHLRFPDNNFNRILSTFMMRYPTPDGQLQALEEMVRTAQHGAQIHVVDYDYVNSYPNQASDFNPERIIQGIASHQFQNRLNHLGKGVQAAYQDLPKGIPERTAHLYHMVVNVG